MTRDWPMREEVGTRVKVEDLSLLGSGRKCGPISEGFLMYDLCVCVIYMVKSSEM